MRDIKQESLPRDLLKRKESTTRRPFSHVSKKDFFFRIIMAIIAHFDLELQQMDVKTDFLNGDLEKKVYMKKPEGLSSSDGEHLVCNSRNPIWIETSLSSVVFEIP